MAQRNDERARFDAVVVAYRSAAFLEPCLIGLIEAGAEHITVVDNSHDEASRALVNEVAASSDVPLRYYPCPANLGYGAGANLGFRLGGPSEWVAFLNPDVELTQNLDPLLRDAALRGEAVIAGVLHTADPRHGANARPRFTIPRELLRGLAGSRRSYHSGLPVRQDTHEVDQLDGCFLVMRKSTFTALGGFDERFELYFEDVDLCTRAASRGGCWLQPRTYGRHIGGASRDRAPTASYLVFRISRIRYLRKWAPRLGTVAACAIGVLELLARSCARAPEGAAVRIRSCSLQLAELKSPDSQWVLSSGRSSTHPAGGRS